MQQLRCATAHMAASGAMRRGHLQLVLCDFSHYTGSVVACRPALSFLWGAVQGLLASVVLHGQ
jgi:hypothetical protein